MPAISTTVPDSIAAWLAPELSGLTLALRNISGQDIAAVMAHIVIVRAAQPVENRWLLRHNFDDSQHNLSPGAIYWISPFGTRVADAKPGGHIGPRPAAWLRDYTAESCHWQAVRLAVDSVLDGSGNLFGPDEAGCIRMFTEWLAADRDIAARVLELRRDSSPQQFRRVLNSQCRNETAQTFFTKDHYTDRWLSQAKRLEWRLCHSGLDSAFHEAERIATQAHARQIRCQRGS